MKLEAQRISALKGRREMTELNCFGPESFATVIAKATPPTVIPMGPGGGCGVRYLFAIDVLGETTGRIPRHERVYDDWRTEHARLHDRRVMAFSAFHTDGTAGQFQNPAETVALAAKDHDMAAFLANPRR